MKRTQQYVLPIVGFCLIILLWTVVSTVISKDLPSPFKTWQESKLYVMEPFQKRGEMDQGIGRLAAYSILRVAKGFFLAILIATPLGFFLGMSKTFSQMM